LGNFDSWKMQVQGSIQSVIITYPRIPTRLVSKIVKHVFNIFDFPVDFVTHRFRAGSTMCILFVALIEAALLIGVASRTVVAAVRNGVVASANADGIF